MHTQTKGNTHTGTLLKASQNSTNLNVKVTNHYLEAKIRQRQMLIGLCRKIYLAVLDAEFLSTMKVPMNNF